MASIVADQCGFRREFPKSVDRGDVFLKRFKPTGREKSLRETTRVSSPFPLYGASGLAALCLDTVNGFKARFKAPGSPLGTRFLKGALRHF